MPLDTTAVAKTATTIRRSIIKMLARAGSGHPGGALGMADVFAVLYFSDILKHNPDNPSWTARDRVFLSNGHICPVLYATLAEAGYFSNETLLTLRQLDSPLQGHPHRDVSLGIENTSGPLGLGLSQAAGCAHALLMDGGSQHVFCITSDGEHQEGQTWEAYNYINKYCLRNLTILIDRNNIQIGGNTHDVMPLEPFSAKLASFGMEVVHINGHNPEEIYAALKQAKTSSPPTAIICQTTPGKGVSFMESKYEWHGKAPSAEEAEQALEELHL